MDAKYYLKRIRTLYVRMNRKTDQINRIRDAATKITQAFGDDAGGHGSGVSDRVGNAAVRLADLEARLDVDVRHYADAVNEGYSLLEKVDDPKLYEVLDRRYFQFERLEVIAEGMHLSVRHILRMHGEALSVFQQILDEKGD